MRAFAERLLRDKSGATAIEYGSKLSGVFNRIATALSAAS